MRDRGQEGKDGELTQGGTLGQTQPHNKAWLPLWGLYRTVSQNRPSLLVFVPLFCHFLGKIKDGILKIRENDASETCRISQEA